MPLVDLVQDQFEVKMISYPTNLVKSYQELTTLVLDELETVSGEYIIVGESFSGPVSLFVSQAKPEDLIGLVLVAVLPFETGI